MAPIIGPVVVIEPTHFSKMGATSPERYSVASTRFLVPPVTSLAQVPAERATPVLSAARLCGSAADSPGGFRASREGDGRPARLSHRAATQGNTSLQTHGPAAYQHWTNDLYATGSLPGRLLGASSRL